MAFLPTAGVITPPSRPASSPVCKRSSSFAGASLPLQARVPLPTRHPLGLTRMALGKTIIGTLQSMPQFSTMLKLASACNIGPLEKGTAFVPTNAAFDRLPPAYIDYLLSRPADLVNLLKRHALAGSVLTTKQIKGCGFFDNAWGGPLGYEGLGPIIRIGNARIVNELCNLECDNGIIHAIDTVLTSPMVKTPGIAQTFVPSVPFFSSSTVASLYPTKMRQYEKSRASKACLPGTTGGRRAMGLMKQLPFWQYGPPFNAAKQEEYEPISIAQPEVASVDYQLLPPGTVVVVPDEVSASKLVPISGMSKYIGQTKRLVGKDGLSEYSRLDDLDV